LAACCLLGVGERLMFLLPLCLSVGGISRGLSTPILKIISVNKKELHRLTANAKAGIYSATNKY
jgi:hypothetical protein